MSEEEHLHMQMRLELIKAMVQADMADPLKSAKVAWEWVQLGAKHNAPSGPGRE